MKSSQVAMDTYGNHDLNADASKAFKARSPLHSLLQDRMPVFAMRLEEREEDVMLTR